jgi:hypothetical protein
VRGGRGKEEERGDKRSNAIFLRYLLLRIDVYFCECYSVGLGVLGCEGFVGGRDGFAGAAPVCVDCGGGVVSKVSGMGGGEEGDEQSVMTIVDVLRSLENSAGEPMDTVDGILMMCCGVECS